MRVRNLLDAHLAQRLLHRQRDVLEEMVRLRTQELCRSRLQVVQRLARAAEYRDEEMGNHVRRMSHIAVALARSAGWDADASELLLHAAPMHDIGKIGIPDAILLKPGKLDADEWRVMMTHAEIGARILDGADADLLEMRNCPPCWRSAIASPTPCRPKRLAGWLSPSRPVLSGVDDPKPDDRLP